jgi:hypothetical protein
MTHEAYFRAEGGAYYANPISAGPWRDDSLMGRTVSGLLGFVIEDRHLEPGWVPARFTVELYELVDFGAVTVETRVLKQGGRMRLVEAELFCGGTSRARAFCQLLRHTEAVQGKVWSAPDWDAPHPDQLTDDPTRGKWQFRMAKGTMNTAGRRQTWMRDYRELVAGVPLSPFAQAALATDFTSPLTSAGELGVEYINTEATLYLHRLPRDGWIGFEVVDHQSTAGVAIGQSRVYDLHGPIGIGSSAGLAQRRPKLDNPLAGAGTGKVG